MSGLWRVYVGFDWFDLQIDGPVLSSGIGSFGTRNAHKGYIRMGGQVGQKPRLDGVFCGNTDKFQPPDRQESR